MKNSTVVSAAAAIAVAALLAAALVVRPPAWAFILPSGVAIQGWRTDALRLAWPLATAVCVVLSLSAWRISAAVPLCSPFAALRPLSWLPAIVALSHCVSFLGTLVSGVALPFGAALVLAACVEGFFFRPSSSCGARHPGLRVRTALVFAASFVFLAALWFGHAKTIGWRGGGDAKHYIAMIENLVEHGDVDLTDRMEAVMAERGVGASEESRAAFFEHSHLKINSSGRIHSYHSFGYPMLAWLPVKMFGFAAEQWLRILLGALGLAGCWASCRAFGASSRSSTALSLLLLPTVPFAYTALALLPEMLGFALVSWAVWAAAAQCEPRRRAVATLVAASCCAYLPVAHVRFAPMALGLAGFFAVEGLCAESDGSVRRKALRLALFSAACLAAWIALWISHARFYEGGGAYDYREVFMSRPLVMWAILADRRGLAATLPLAWPLFVSPVAVALHRGRDARRAALCLAVALVIVVSCCSTIYAFIGNCMVGRFLIPAVPVLFPTLALALDRTDRAGRTWVFFLASLAVLLFAFASFAFTKNGITVSPEPMREASRLQTFWEPLPSYFRGASGVSRSWGTSFAVIGMALSLLACLPSRRHRLRLFVFAVLLASAFFTGRASSLAQPPRRDAVFEALCADRGLRSWRIVSGRASTLFEAFGGRPGKSSALPKTIRASRRADASAPAWRPLRGRGIPPTPAPCRIAFRVSGSVDGGSALVRFVSGDKADAPTSLGAGAFDCVVSGTTAPGGATNLELAPLGENCTVSISRFEFVPVPSGIEEVLPLEQR